jgi:hypothetical protein
MKFIHIFINDFKTKWSTKLLVGVFALVVSSIFASNLILKNEYDMNKNKPKDRFAGYQKMVNQPFKHIVVDSSNFIGEIYIESSNQPSVYVSKFLDIHTLLAQNIFVRNDTLFVKLNETFFSQLSVVEKRQIKQMNPFLHVLSPDIQSISVSNSDIKVDTLHQKRLNINLSNNAHFEMNNCISDLDFCKVSIQNFSNFVITERIVDKKINIKSAEIDMRDSSALYLKFANIDTFKFNATQGNTVELSSETLMNLMKK